MNKRRMTLPICAMLSLLAVLPAFAGKQSDQRTKPMPNTKPNPKTNAVRAGNKTDQAVGARVDQFVKRVMQATRIPGLSLAIVRDGKPIKIAAYGIANVEHEVAATPETVYLLASVTKSFTATAIMLLVEDGKISLDAPLSRYLPDTPKTWEAITVTHLLTHTAGLTDRFEGRKPEEWLLNFTTAQMYDASRKQSLDFAPGTRWQYSDQGYFLLGMIIEKVSGKSYRQFLTERIFQPLGMSATTTSSQNEIVKHLASGYTLANGALQHNHRRTDYGLVSHFGIVSNVVDMAKFDAALSAGKLLKPATLEKMWTAGHSAVGAWGSYGFGWFLSDFFGHRIVQHGGSTGTVFWKLPDDKLTVIVLTNLEALAGGDATSIARMIARLYVPAVSWNAQKPKTDPDPAVTAALREELVRLSDGKPKLELYTAGFEAAVRASAQSARGFYQAIGELRSLSYLGGQSDGKEKTRFYRADYKALTLFYTATFDADGKIAYLAGEPETLP